MASSLLRLGAAATAASLLLLGGAAAHATEDNAGETAGPGDSAEVTGSPDSAETDDDATDDGSGEESDQLDDWYPLEPTWWTEVFQELGVTDASCFSAELPSDGLFVADQDYLAVIDLWEIQSDALDGNLYLDVWTDDEIEVGTDVENDKLILCTGTIPADWDPDWDFGLGEEEPGGEERPISDDKAGGDDEADDDTAGVGSGDDDSGEKLGPVVQTDRPRQDGNLAATGDLALALAAAGLAALRLRRAER